MIYSYKHQSLLTHETRVVQHDGLACWTIEIIKFRGYLLTLKLKEVMCTSEYMSGRI